MSSTERDTHFAGFAQVLLQEMFEGRSYIDFSKFDEDVCEQYQLLFARRAYDLVHHAMWNIASIDLERLSMDECTHKIPDLSALPEVQA